MGPTGSGKSTVRGFLLFKKKSAHDVKQFIEIAAGIKGIAGHGLKSYTDEISVIKFSIPEILDSDICLVDTPGFDDTNKSDVDIFKMISDWLNDTYVTICMFRVSPHKVSDTRERSPLLVCSTSTA